ncbi:hypothetical protein NUW54_g9025 [Trametes sanguinea]|uniref:Uncharacterized protein n=1 Tax=Trametes sanguinea TaxID=158606 RepID=A0ACC1P928_9APHY|nr:hypothetical protein NUW54_g9025 [Trametes sanguinea]
MSPATLPTRRIGNVDVTAIGYGHMTYSEKLPDEERFKFLDALYESGCTNWDTANVYGDSEEFIGKWFARTGKRNEIFLATKFGLFPEPGKAVNGEPAYVHESIERSLKRLCTDYVDLYYLHRADPNVPIELTVRAMAELVKCVTVFLRLSVSM